MLTVNEVGIFINLIGRNSKKAGWELWNAFREQRTNERRNYHRVIAKQAIMKRH
jgi:hypothetical protein